VETSQELKNKKQYFKHHSFASYRIQLIT